MATDKSLLVLDAMGVIYEVGDDVGELLVPFIREKNGHCDISAIDRLYDEAILGRLTAKQFWIALGLDPQLEDEYLQRYRLSSGAMEFLQRASKHFSSIWCLSNDLSEWSLKLRRRFDLEANVGGFVVSGDVGCRKPESRIFEILLGQVRAEPTQIIFVDDKKVNLDTAASLGFETVLFDARAIAGPAAHRVARSFDDLAKLILG
ncbi:MAG: HAD family hydrolase [Candidatus Binatia bacterium]